VLLPIPLLVILLVKTEVVGLVELAATVIVLGLEVIPVQATVARLILELEEMVMLVVMLPVVMVETPMEVMEELPMGVMEETQMEVTGEAGMAMGTQVTQMMPETIRMS